MCMLCHICAYIIYIKIQDRLITSCQPSHPYKRTQTRAPQLEASVRNGSASPTGNQGSVPTKMRRNL